MRTHSEYTVYFEVFGKKLKTTVHAFNEEGAEKLVKERAKASMIIYKIEKIDTAQDAIYKFLKGFSE